MQISPSAAVIFGASKAIAGIFSSQFQQNIFFPTKYKGGLILSFLSPISFWQVETVIEWFLYMFQINYLLLAESADLMVLLTV
jgi:hypothetical protein